MSITTITEHNKATIHRTAGSKCKMQWSNRSSPYSNGFKTDSIDRGPGNPNHFDSGPDIAAGSCAGRLGSNTHPNHFDSGWGPRLPRGLARESWIRARIKMIRKWFQQSKIAGARPLGYLGSQPESNDSTTIRMIRDCFAGNPQGFIRMTMLPSM